MVVKGRAVRDWLALTRHQELRKRTGLLAGERDAGELRMLLLQFGPTLSALLAAIRAVDLAHREQDCFGFAWTVRSTPPPMRSGTWTTHRLSGSQSCASSRALRASCQALAGRATHSVQAEAGMHLPVWFYPAGATHTRIERVRRRKLKAHFSSRTPEYASAPNRTMS